MPAKSKKQRAIMALALGVRKKKISPDKVSKKVLDIADSGMTVSQLKDFAKTTNKEIKANENINISIEFILENISDEIKETLDDMIANYSGEIDSSAIDSFAEETGIDKKEIKSYLYSKAKYQIKYGDKYTIELVKQLANSRAIDISSYDIHQIILGMDVELEHGTKLGQDTNVTDNDPFATLQIVLAHLKEIPDYYDPYLLDMEEKAEKKNKTNENIGLSNISGMGPVVFPGNPGSTTSFNSQKSGSGDMPVIPKRACKKRKLKHMKTYKEYSEILNSRNPNRNSQ